ncbi:AEC family transporter [Sphingomonas oryzagri]
MLATYGSEALALTTIATILTVCIFFAVAIVLIEIGLQSERRRAHIAKKVSRSLASNPLVIAPILGASLSASGLVPPAPVESFLKLLGGAASPCALVALGLFLAEKREKIRGQAKPVTLLVFLKLFAQPLATRMVATLHGLSSLQTRTAVLLSMLPTGTFPFMLAEFYRREADMTRQVVLASTADGSL